MEAYQEIVHKRRKEALHVLKDDKFIAYFKKYLAICGLMINSDRVWHIYSTIVSLHVSSACALMLYSAYYFRNEIESTAVIIHHCTLIYDSQIGAFFFLMNKNVMKFLVTEMSYSYNYDSALVTAFLDKMTKERKRKIEMAFKLTVGTQISTLLNLVLAAVAELYTRNVKYLLQFPCWFPFDLGYFPYQLFAILWGHSLVELACCTIFGVMGLIFLVYSHLTTQFELLQFAITKSRERAFEYAMRTNVPSEHKQGKDRETNELEKRIKEGYIEGMKMCVEHHLHIIQYFDYAGIIFRVVYFLIFISGFLILTCTGFALMSDNGALKVKFTLITMTQLVFLYIVCWFANEVAVKSEDLRFAIYSIEWYDMPKECISILRLMLVRTMKPLWFYTLSGQKVDLENYMSMIKASYSYFNMMLATQEKQ